LWSLSMADARVATWLMPTDPGENPLSLWAPRYYHDRG